MFEKWLEVGAGQMSISQKQKHSDGQSEGAYGLISTFR